MTDGISAARREEAAIKGTIKALFELEEALDDVYDCVFGLPSWAVDEINVALGKYRLRATPAPGPATNGEAMKPSDFVPGTYVKIVGPDFNGMIGKVVTRPPARYVFVQFPEDEEMRSHPMRVDEIERGDQEPSKVEGGTE